MSLIFLLQIINIFTTASSKVKLGKFKLVIIDLFSKKIISFYIGIGIYLALIVTLFNRFGVWEFSLYKDFIYWFFTTGMVLFFNVSDLKTNNDFTKIILTSTSSTIILEFIVGFYNFSLVWELILVPTLTFISILAFVAEIKKEDSSYKLVATFLNNFLAIISFGFLIYGMYQLINNHNEFFTLNNFKS